MSNALKICIVDDDAFMLMLLSDHISKNPNHEVFTFSSGEACLNQLAIRPNVFIIDHQLDGENENASDGISIIKQIRTRQLEASIILLTSLDLESIHLNDHKLKDVNYVQKGSSAFTEIDKILAKIQ